LFLKNNTYLFIEFWKTSEKAIGAIDDAFKRGTLKEYGYFMDGASGYMITEAEAADLYRTYTHFFTYYKFEHHC